MVRGMWFEDERRVDEKGGEAGACGCRPNAPKWRVSATMMLSAACIFPVNNRRAPASVGRKALRFSALRRAQRSGLERHQDVEELLAVARLLDVHELAV